MKEINIASIIVGFLLLLVFAELTGKHESKPPQYCHEWTEGASRAMVCVRGSYIMIYNSGGVSLESVEAVRDSLFN